MKKLFALIITLGLSFSIFANTNIPNIGQAKPIVAKYYNGGQYLKDVNATVNKVLTYLNQKLKNTHNKKLAMVFDIDDTVLNSSKLDESIEFGYYAPLWLKWEKTGAFTAITPMHKIFAFAKNHHIDVFFISARRHELLKCTAANLKKAGFGYYKHIYLRPKHISLKDTSAVTFKTHFRKLIESKGYDIILSMGDQHSDLTGGYADKTFKLPNYMYHVS